MPHPRDGVNVFSHNDAFGLTSNDREEHPRPHSFYKWNRGDREPTLRTFELMPKYFIVIIMMAASQDDELNAGTMVPFDLIRGSHDRRITKMMNLNPKVF